MKNLILYICFFLAVTTMMAQEKQIHFAHGLSGSTNSWAMLEGIVNNNCPLVNTTNGTYNSTDGIAAYTADYVASQGGGASNNDIAIGHSFGGIALRAMDQNNNGLFGGYITIASPHGGAQLANSVNDGLLEIYLENACSQVIDDPLTAATNTLLSSPLTLFFGFITTTISNGSSILCNNLWEATLIAEGLFGNPFTGTGGQTIDELEVGGAGSNLPASTLPSVGITGQANDGDDVHWALIQDRTGSNVPATMQNVEDEFRNIADILFGISGSLRVSWWNPTSWLFGGLRVGLINTSVELNEGADWIETSEAGWTELIGAGGGITFIEELVEVPAFEPCLSDGECGSNEKCINQQCISIDGGPCDIPPQQTTTIVILRPVANPDMPNDGVVTVDSQLLPGSLRTEAVNNVTHFGEQTDLGVHGVISEQFDPNRAVDFVFIIDGCTF